MTDEQIKKVADDADMIVKGYAFTKREDGFISILNLNDTDSSMVVNSKGEIMSTNMDGIEQHIVKELCNNNLKFMDFLNA